MRRHDISSGWRRDGEVCSPEVVDHEGMQVNICIGMIAGVSLLNFEDLFLEWTGEEGSDVERALDLA